MNLKVLLLVIFFSAILSAQTIERLTVTTPEGTKYIPVYDREGTVYFAVKPMADALSAKYFYAQNEGKVKLTFENYSLYISLKNPFIVLTKKNSNGLTIYQLPTSTYYLNNHLYLPLTYCLDILRLASEMKLNFQKPDKLIIQTMAKNESEAESIKETAHEESGYDISHVVLDEKANGTLVKISSRKRIYSYNSSFKNGVLTIVLRNVHANVNALDKSGGDGLIKWIKAKNLKSDTEVQFGLSKEYTNSEVLNVDNSNDILIAFHNKIFDNNTIRKKEKAKWDFNVIVIDAGHGGKDSGTLGVDGIKEKDVNLGIALKLGKEIAEKMKDVKVVYTRKTDKFIELYRRGQIANEANGNLFISIHCNATPKKPSDANGSEVYLLRPGRTKEAISIAERENSVISYEDNPKRYQKLTDENFILVSMAQSAYMRYSEKFADLVNKEFGKDTGIEPRGVKQAGFYVLVGASMPSVLVEAGFLSNRKDAHYLASAKGQASIANAIFDAIKKFREVYEKNIEAE